MSEANVTLMRYNTCADLFIFCFVLTTLLIRKYNLVSREFEFSFASFLLIVEQFDNLNHAHTGCY